MIAVAVPTVVNRKARRLSRCMTQAIARLSVLALDGRNFLVV